MDATDEALLRSLHTHLCIRWGTEAPFQIGSVSAQKVGFAEIPRVVVPVWCREEDVSALVPIVRQRVFAELASRGWTDEVVEFTPGVRLESRRRRKFTDENEESETFGRARYGHQHVFGFDIRDKHFRDATFQGFGSFAKLPEWKENR